MKKINAIDLDRTLLPYDSLTALALRMLRVPGAAPRVLWYGALRKLRLLGRRAFLARLVTLLRALPEREALLAELVARFRADADRGLLDLLAGRTDADTVNVLCTASPSDYAEPLARALGWDCVCSLVEGGAVTLHAYGSGKAAEVRRRYPPDSYAYNFAVSDSPSDLELLEMFAEHKIV